MEKLVGAILAVVTLHLVLDFVDLVMWWKAGRPTTEALTKDSPSDAECCCFLGQTCAMCVTHGTLPVRHAYHVPTAFTTQTIRPSQPSAPRVTETGRVGRNSGCAHDWMAVNVDKRDNPDWTVFPVSAPVIYRLTFCAKCRVLASYGRTLVPDVEPPPSTYQKQDLQPSAQEPAAAPSPSSVTSEEACGLRSLVGGRVCRRIAGHEGLHRYFETWEWA